jgi:hypothetical protein
MSELCRLLIEHGSPLGIRFGWKQDSVVVFGEEPSWVLYVDLPQHGQCSFHSPNRMAGSWQMRPSGACRHEGIRHQP